MDKTTKKPVQSNSAQVQKRSKFGFWKGLNAFGCALLLSIGICILLVYSYAKIAGWGFLISLIGFTYWFYDKTDSKKRAWGQTFIGLALESFALPLVMFIFTVVFVARQTQTSNAFEALGSAVGGGIVIIFSAILGFFLGIILLIAGIFTLRSANKFTNEQRHLTTAKQDSPKPEVKLISGQIPKWVLIVLGGFVILLIGVSVPAFCLGLFTPSEPSSSTPKTVTPTTEQPTTIPPVEQPAQQPVATQCIPQWSCSEWSSCSSTGRQTRSCTDQNHCGTSSGKPVETTSCTPPVYTENDVKTADALAKVLANNQSQKISFFTKYYFKSQSGSWGSTVSIATPYAGTVLSIAEKIEKYDEYTLDDVRNFLNLDTVFTNVGNIETTKAYYNFDTSDLRAVIELEGGTICRGTISNVDTKMGNIDLETIVNDISF